MAMHLHVFGFGFTAQALADLMPIHSQTQRITPPEATRAALQATTHLLITAPPGADGDPCLARFSASIRAAPHLCWIGYCSTTGVYGDRGGGVVDETSLPAPGQPRSVMRLAAEQAWRDIRPDLPLDLLRLAGIYGPGRCALDDLRTGRARCIIAADHKFSRIHRIDAARAIAAAMQRPGAPGARVLHLADDEPTPSADVVRFAARLLGLPPPPPVPLADALAQMSPMAQSFWAESRLIANTATKNCLDLQWRFPSYREGLRFEAQTDGSFTLPNDL